MMTSVIFCIIILHYSKVKNKLTLRQIDMFVGIQRRKQGWKKRNTQLKMTFRCWHC